jgi:tryptophanyl-tRNA synthetase
VDVLIANYHAPEEQNVENSLRTLQAFGVSKIRMQKEVFDAELYFRLLSIAKIGDLARMTQFRGADEDHRTAHLLTYPVLMAHDVAGYDEVLVGSDQKQHLLYARKLLRKYNKVYNGSFPLPTPNLMGGKVKDLKEPTKKMSKSSPQGCIFLDDSEQEVRRKLKKATADEAGLENLAFLYREFVGEEVPASNAVLKETLAGKIIEKVTNLGSTRSVF